MPRRHELRLETQAIALALFDAAAQGIIGVNAEGTIELANPMAETMFGYDRAELVGQPVEKLLPAHLRERHEAHRATYGELPKNRPMGIGLDLHGRRKDGTEFPVEVSLTHLEISRGRMTFAFLTDISVRKQAEFLLRKTESELHQLAGSLLTAQEDERRRIARDLHDDVTQELALLASEMDQLMIDLPAGEAQAHNRLPPLLSKVTRILHKIRQVSHGLHPSVIEDLGLSVALRVLCEEFGAAHGIEVHFTMDAQIPKLNTAMASSLYRLGQECLQNAAKHARASGISVRLNEKEQQIELIVRDNGVGFSVDESVRRGLGIASMKERVRSLSGTLAISSWPGKGTEIRTLVPLRHSAQAPASEAT